MAPLFSILLLLSHGNSDLFDIVKVPAFKSAGVAYPAQGMLLNLQSETQKAQEAIQKKLPESERQKLTPTSGPGSFKQQYDAITDKFADPDPPKPDSSVQENANGLTDLPKNTEKRQAEGDVGRLVPGFFRS